MTSPTPTGEITTMNRNSSRCLAVLSLLLAAGSAAADGTQDTPPNCQNEAVLRICARHVSLSTSSRWAETGMKVEASATLQLTNTAAEPIVLFYPGGEPFSITPDSGVQLDGAPAVTGLPVCGKAAM